MMQDGATRLPQRAARSAILRTAAHAHWNYNFQKCPKPGVVSNLTFHHTGDNRA